MPDTRKQAMETRIQRAQGEKGLIIVHTGNGKGKTTAAFGMLLRALGHGLTCAVVQFVKGRAESAETALVSPKLTWDRVGEGFTWNTQDRERDAACARAGWELALKHLANPGIEFLLLDELNIVLASGALPMEDVMAALRAKRESLHVVITGRRAPAELIERADLVTEMKEIKHPFKQGIKAQRGIEF